MASHFDFVTNETLAKLRCPTVEELLYSQELHPISSGWAGKEWGLL
jgi:hypothetical protein